MPERSDIENCDLKPHHRKKRLKIEDVVGKMTYQDAIRFFRPDWNDEQCEFYLWEETCYPFSTEVLIEQLNNQLG